MIVKKGQMTVPYFYAYYLLTASLSDLPALNAGALQGGQVILAFVLGLMQVFSPLSRTSNVPKPVIETLSPFSRAS